MTTLTELDKSMHNLLEFVRESNRIEGILRDPTDAEIAKRRLHQGCTL